MIGIIGFISLGVFVFSLLIALIKVVMKKSPKTYFICSIVSFIILVICFLSVDTETEKPDKPEKKQETVKEPQKEVEPVKVPVPETKPQLVDSDWNAEISTISQSTATNTEKSDAVMLLATKHLSEFSQDEITSLSNELISSYTSRTYLDDMGDHEKVLLLQFKARVVEKYYIQLKDQGNPRLHFAGDFLQNVKYVYRGVDAPDSDAVKSNETQMDRALGNMSR